MIGEVRTSTVLTTTVKVFVDVRVGFILSNKSELVTIVVIVLVLGLCGIVGVHVIIPLELMAMPTGGLTRL